MSFWGKQREIKISNFVEPLQQVAVSRILNPIYER